MLHARCWIIVTFPVQFRGPQVEASTLHSLVYVTFCSPPPHVTLQLLFPTAAQLDQCSSPDPDIEPHLKTAAAPSTHTHDIPRVHLVSGRLLTIASLIPRLQTIVPTLPSTMMASLYLMSTSVHPPHTHTDSGMTTDRLTTTPMFRHKTTNMGGHFSKPEMVVAVKDLFVGH